MLFIQAVDPVDLEGALVSLFHQIFGGRRAIEVNLGCWDHLLVSFLRPDSVLLLVAI